ncbi:MAG: arylesterase [Gammaproteobacteria bacterium]|nr:arylesterase [Gammaproteobacteria bacterium]MBU1556945.1 arylesterase [Gammaproteobacteria bacterium]MBU2071808.1 arylesterase [Gammaproteobacteria bacterium]MBU2184124.1 arylesterase [Gammaproteobacteria bacterium]MBU2204277.1 arylesterase [Gammaproteobacteria bacterium]
MRIFLFLLIGCFSQYSFAEKLLILGDSLSAAYGMQQHEGWAHLLQQNTHWQLINASISGETTAGGLARLPALLTQHKPDAVLIELGGNDGLRGFPVATAKSNLNEIISLVKQHNATPVLMQIRIPPNYGPRYVQQFSAIYPQLAEQQQVTLWPFFMDNIATNSELMLPDGIHPNQAAQPLISKFVGKLLADLAPE